MRAERAQNEKKITIFTEPIAIHPNPNVQNLIEHFFTDSDKIKTFAKGEMLQRAGEPTSKAFLIKKGLVRSYTIDEKGKEHIFLFGSEGWLVSDIEAQAFNGPTVLFIEAIEHTEVVVLEAADFKPAEREPSEQATMIAALVKRIGVMQRRILSLMSDSARERYEAFLQLYPELPNRVPQKMIASYLGITPEALSTIRNKIAKGK